MAKYKVIMIDENGYEDEQDEIFDNRQAAEDYGLYIVGCADLGAEILNMSNPGDYPLEEAEKLSFRVERV